MAAGLASVLLLLGGSLLAGHLAHLLFRRHRLSDILVLLLVGVLVGPVLRLVDPAPLAPAFGVLAPLALVVVLFEGGLSLAWNDVRAHAPRALALTLVVWLLSASVAALLAYRLLGLPPVLAILFGVIVCATGILAVIPLLSQLGVAARPRVLLTVETSVGDLLSAVATVAIASALVLGVGPWHGALLFGAKILLGVAVGLLAGLAGARMLHRLEGERHGYAVTLGALLVAYALAEAIGGSGFLAALVFGLVLGNVGALARHGLRDLAPLPSSMRLQQTTLIFLLRSVYFVLLGVAVSPHVLTAPYLAAALALGGGLFLARAAGVLLTTPRGERDERLLLTALMPRGLAAAALAAVPAAMGVPGTADLVAYAFLAIVGADVATGIAIFVYERRRRRGVLPAAPPAVVG